MATDLHLRHTDYMKPYILHYAPDNASLIIRLVLEELDAPYETRLVDRSIEAQKSSAYRALNPTGQIPVLETGDGPVSETAAILLWLADTHAAMAPPAGSPARGPFLKWLFFMSNSLQAGLRMSFYPEIYVGADSDAQAALRTQMQTVLSGHLDLLNRQAAEKHSWFCAAQASVFDYYVVACLRWCALYPQLRPNWFLLTDFPNLHRLALGMETRPAVERARTAEGLGPTPFSSPQLACPPEGTAQ